MEENKNTEEELVKQFDSKSSKGPIIKILVVVLAMSALGIGSGFLIAKGSASKPVTTNEVTKSSDIKKGDTFGTNDTKTFSDEAEGLLREGGIEGEGQFHLERPGGESQYVYLTSSAVDLSLVKGRKIKVWGQTQKAQHAGWLMDVGRIEVLN